MREAETPVGWYPGELPGEEFPRELIPFGIVDGVEQLADPGAPTGGLGEVAGTWHGEIKISGEGIFNRKT